MSMENISRVVMEMDSEGHSHSQRQGSQSLIVPGVQSRAQGDPQVRHRSHLKDNKQIWQQLCG